VPFASLSAKGIKLDDAILLLLLLVLVIDPDEKGSITITGEVST